MNNLVLLALLATLGTWFVTALGAATVVFFPTPDTNLLNLMLGYASGVMIAASFWSLLQPAIERAEALDGLPAYLVATIGFLSGALFMWASDKIVNFARNRANATTGKQNEKLNRIIMLVLSITLHNIPEGLAVGVAPWQKMTAPPKPYWVLFPWPSASVCRIFRRVPPFPCHCEEKAIPGGKASFWGSPPAWWSPSPASSEPCWWFMWNRSFPMPCPLPPVP